MPLHLHRADGRWRMDTLGAPLTAACCSASAARCDSCELTHAGLTRMSRVSRDYEVPDHERGPGIAHANESVVAVTFTPGTTVYMCMHACGCVIFLHRLNSKESSVLR